MNIILFVIAFILPFAIVIWILLGAKAKRKKNLLCFISKYGYQLSDNVPELDSNLEYLKETTKAVNVWVYVRIKGTFDNKEFLLFDHRSGMSCVIHNESINHNRLFIINSNSLPNHQVGILPQYVNLMTKLKIIKGNLLSRFQDKFIVYRYDEDSEVNLIPVKAQELMLGHNKNWPFIIDIKRSIIAVRTKRLSNENDLRDLIDFTCKLVNAFQQ